MKLWIRSQDKETLLPIDKPLMYWESIDNIHTHSIIFKESPSYIITLGTYKTKERALEVLDEIQKFIMLKEEADYKTNIYEMPED